MAKKVTIELNSAGIIEMMNSDEMQKIVKGIADKAQRKLGKGYETSVQTGKTRCNASVAAVTGLAKRENRKDNKVLKAVFEVAGNAD